MSSEITSKCIIHFPPARPKIDRPSVILYGTIESDPKNNWATNLSLTLSDLPIAILNPRRDDWDSSWKEDVSFAPFKEQTDWEIDYAGIADVIVFYFKPGSLTPVALLELGMHAATYGKRCVVCCPRDFYKRGNVEIVCGRFGVEMVEELEKLGKVVKERMEELLENVRKT